MKTKASVTIITLVMMITLWAGLASAEKRCIPLFRGLSCLDLTNDQKANLEKMKTEHCKKMIKFRADLSIAHLEKEAMIKDKDFKKEVVQKQVEKIMAIETNMQMARLDALTKLRTVLDVKQWDKFTNCLGRRGDGCNWYQRGGHHGGRYKGGNFNCGMNRGWNMGNCPYYEDMTKADF